jgi:hypothetical protein
MTGKTITETLAALGYSSTYTPERPAARIAVEEAVATAIAHDGRVLLRVYEGGGGEEQHRAYLDVPVSEDAVAERLAAWGFVAAAEWTRGEEVDRVVLRRI